MKLVIDPDISIETTLIPPMMVQPLVENAIRQGLLCSGRPGKLLLEIIKDSSRVYRFVIAENDDCSKSQDELRESDRLAFTNITDAAGRHDGTRVEVTFPLVVD